MPERVDQELSRRTSVEEAIAWIDAQVGRLEAEDVDLAEATGRVLAGDAVSVVDVPAFNRLAVDGIAVRADETIGASPYNPLSFRLVAAGEGLAAAAGVRLSAGDPLPDGADAIVPIEHASLTVPGVCEIVDTVMPGNEIERAGSHIACGATLLTAGRRLCPHDIGLLASAGIAQVPVIRRAKVLVILTGRGLVEPGRSLPPETDYDADGPLLRALIERDGGILTDVRRTDQDRTALRSALAAPGPDIVLVVGSAGHGADDETAAALAEAGELAIRGVALRPGEAAGMGRTATSVPVFLLPGAPVACLWVYEFFAGRAIRHLAGRNPMPPFRSGEMPIARKIVSTIGTTEVCPVRRRSDDRVEPIASFAETGLAAATRADGFVVVPEGSEGFAEGAVVTVYLYEVCGGTHGLTLGEAGPKP
jgi:molybdopterin molybdotransferase